MPQLTVEGHGTFEVPQDKKVVLAVEDAGIAILHRCGGNARCITCRVEILDGTVAPMQEAEREALEEPELIEKYRLSCQIRMEGDLSLRLWKTAQEAEMEPGTRPAD